MRFRTWITAAVFAGLVLVDANGARAQGIPTIRTPTIRTPTIRTPTIRTPTIRTPGPRYFWFIAAQQASTDGR
jgi:hypothetical protein